MKTNKANAAKHELPGRISCTKSISTKSSGILGLIFIVAILLESSFTACTRVNSSFYDKVLNDYDTTSYFIAVDIKSPFYKGRTIIENNNLYLYLHKTRGFDKDKYKSFMKRILFHHRVLKIEDRDFLSWKFIKVHELESVIQSAYRGRDSFVAHYFNGIVLNYGISDEEQNAVINQLFFWEIPAKIDKLTGNLIIG